MGKPVRGWNLFANPPVGSVWRDSTPTDAKHCDFVVESIATEDGSPFVWHRRIGGNQTGSNDAVIQWAVGSMKVGHRLAAWGAVPPRLHSMALPGMSYFKSLSAQSLRCLGTTKGGEPRHPLMLAYETPLAPLHPRST